VVILNDKTGSKAQSMEAETIDKVSIKFLPAPRIEHD
jgi:hypothetical protein